VADVVDRKTRSRMMSGIRGKDTSPERLVRSGLHAMGYRYRVHRTNLPGKPDLVLPAYNAVIEIRGCFWHGHDCHLFKWPSTRSEFWKSKIEGTQIRDERNISSLMKLGWRVLVVWECSLKGKTRLLMPDLLESISNWLQSDTTFMRTNGTRHGSC